MGLRQTGVPIATGKSRKVRKEPGQTTVESKPNEEVAVGTVALILVAETMEKVAGVPLNVTLVVSPQHFPRILITSAAAAVNFATCQSGWDSLWCALIDH